MLEKEEFGFLFKYQGIEFDSKSIVENNPTIHLLAVDSDSNGSVDKEPYPEQR